MSQEIKYVELTNEQKQFLMNYEPKDDFITSEEEIKEINTNFGLDKIKNTEILRSIRNSVVKFYRIDRNKFNSMMSVTAVIDHYMYRVNPMSV